MFVHVENACSCCFLIRSLIPSCFSSVTDDDDDDVDVDQAGEEEAVEDKDDGHHDH